MVNLSGLNPIFAARLSAAVAAAEAATGAKASFRSGVRTTAEQAKLYANYRSGKGGIAARPGKSLHEQGMAVDLGPGPVRNWIDAHAKQYGLEPAIPKRGWGADPPHVQLARGTLKTAYDSTPSAFADGRYAASPAVAAVNDMAAGASAPRDKAFYADLQSKLADAGLYHGKIDGINGPQTKAAVRAVESQYNLSRDKGVAGRQVQAALAGTGKTKDITDALALTPPGGPGGPPANPQDIAFGRAQASMPWDVSGPTVAARGRTDVGLGRGLDSRLAANIAPGGVPAYARGESEIAGSGGLTSGGPPSQMPSPPFDLSGGSLTAGGGAPGASATMAMGGPPAPVSPDPNQFGPDMAFLSRLAQPMDTSLPARVPGGPAASPAYVHDARPAPYFWSGPGPGELSPPGDVPHFDTSRFASEPNAGGMPPISHGTSINDVLAGIGGIPAAWGNALSNLLGGGSEPAPAGMPPSPAYVQPAVIPPNQGPELVGPGQGQPLYMTSLSREPVPVTPLSPAAEQARAADMRMWQPGYERNDNLNWLSHLNSASINRDALYALRQPSVNVEDRRGTMGGVFDGPDTSGIMPAFHAVPGGFSGSGGDDYLRGSAGNAWDPRSPSVSGNAPLGRRGDFGGYPVGSPGDWLGGGPSPAEAEVPLFHGQPIGGELSGTVPLSAPGVTPAGGEPAPFTPGGAGYTTIDMNQVAPGVFDGGSAPLSYSPPPAVRSQDVKQSAVTALAHALSSGAGLSAPSRSGSGSTNPMPSYPGGYMHAGTTQWGSPQYYTGSSYSNSPFTPSGYTAPSFSQGSGGPTYAYHSNGDGTGTYVDSHGQVHSY